MKITIVDANAKKVGEADLAPAVFGGEVKASLLHDMVVAQLATRRRGTRKTKGRSEVRGGGAKPWRQKGLGRARAGSIRSPLFKGGGIVFGPTPATYRNNMPKKARKGALKSALAVKAQEEAVMAIKGFDFSEPKTREAVRILTDLGVAGKKVLIVIDAANPAVEKSFRNIPEVKTIRAEGINVYDLLNAETVLFTEQALGAVTERLG